MNSEMILDTLRLLQLRWGDLAVVFQRFAESLPTAPAPPTMLLDPADPNSEIPLADFVGLPTTPAGTPSLRSRALAEAERLRQEIETLEDAPDRLTAALLTSVGQPAGSPDGAVEIVTASQQWEDLVRDDAFPPAPGFVTHFGGTPNDVANDTLERAACRTRLDQLRDFIARTLRSFLELNDGTGFTERFEARSLRNSVNNLFAYPVLTSEVDGRGGGGNSGTGSSSGGGTAISVKRTAQVALREVLGRAPRTGDTRSFLAALTHTFTATEQSGYTVYRWTPRTYSGQTDLGGGVTGAQASLYGRAKVTLDNAVPLLEGLYSLREDADEELVKAARNITRAELTEIVTELGTEGGPRVARVNNLFDLLLVNRFTVLGAPQPVTGHLGMLAHELGLKESLVNTLDEESNFTNFIALRDYVSSLRSGWDDFRRVLGTDMGTQFVQLSRALSVTTEAVDEVNDAMDSVRVSSAERQVATFAGADGRLLSVGDLLSWISSFTSQEAPTLVQEGGRRGAESLIPTARLLNRSVELLVNAVATDRGLSDGLRQARVVNALQELSGHLLRIEGLASRLRRT
jgi:hypothetical protein